MGDDGTADLPGLEPEPLARLPSKADLARRWANAFDERFWPAVPRKVGKVAARRAWAKLQPKVKLKPTSPEAWKAAFSETFCNVLDLLRYRCEHDWADRDDEKIPHPATFLNAESFDTTDVDDITRR